MLTWKKKAARWLALFGKRRSPELFGMLYVHAKQNFEIGRTNRSRRQDTWKEARTTITRIEAVDNEYSTRATNLKISHARCSRSIQSCTFKIIDF